MAKKTKKTRFGLSEASEAILPLGLFGILLLLIMPVPPGVLDAALALSIASSLLVLLVVLSIKDPAEFTGFPTLLLIATLFRLSLNVASTRLILLEASAGNIIEAFGNFVVRGNYIVGLVVFIILVLVNFIVITKGAGRVAEVAARFTLDAMPGKQMSIDADLNAGIIDEHEARRRRTKIEEEADFYGAMDGASKFVRGDAVAGILITLINVIGGFGIGVFQKGMPVVESMQRYSLLSIGDGLVSQIPALITSTAAGILVTRATAKNHLADQLTDQLFYSYRALGVLSGMMFVMMLVPGFPKLIFFVLATALALLAFYLPRLRPKKDERTGSAPAGAAGAAAAAAGDDPASPDSIAKPAEQEMEAMLKVDALQVELGYGLVHMADKRKGGELLSRISGIRKNFAKELGIIVPPIKVKDNLQFQANEYVFSIKGSDVIRGEILPGHWLAMNATGSQETLKGVPTTEPVYQLPATWITEVEKKEAEIKGFTVVDATTVLVTHLSETIKRNSADILSRQDVQRLIDHLKDSHSAVINELIPEQLTVGQVQRILQNLLAEGLSIRNLPEILEKVSDFAGMTKNPDELSEQARTAMGRLITKPYQAPDGSLSVISLDPSLEKRIAQGVHKTPNEVTLILDPSLAQALLENLSKTIQKMISAGLHPVLVCAPQVRMGLYRFFRTTFAELRVISFAEIPSNANLKNFAVVAVPGA